MNNNDIISIGNTATSLIPEEGEVISIRGGLGNRVLSQRKKENGKYYVRDNEESEWVENPDMPWEIYERMKKLLGV